MPNLFAGSRRHAGRRRASRLPSLLALLFAMTSPRVGFATPHDFVPVGDPIEDELRILDVLGPSAGAPLRLPHLGMRPLQAMELDGVTAGPDLSPARRIARERVARWLARDRAASADSSVVPGVSRRLVQRTYDDEQRFELSAGLEGRGESVAHQNSRFTNGSGLQGRAGVQSGAWLGYSHLFVGQVDNARSFADPIALHNDVIVYSEDTYLAASGADARWSFQFGRTRWHFGPGDEGSLLLSKTSAPLFGLAFHVRVEPLRLDAFTLSATIDAAAGEQLAAHRVEWQALDGLRLGVSEVARYRSDAWQPAYLVGVVPYLLVQDMQLQDQPDSVNAIRNNEVIGFDAAWRVAPGTRVYGEVAIDDLHARTNDNPNKLAYQFGWEGVGTWGGTRLTWGTEYTRLDRFVYTSYFGRELSAQNRPLGFPTGPDARRVRVHGTWDLSSAWQVLGAVARTDKGENDLGEPYVPGTPKPDASTFEGVVERTREMEVGVRFWPSGGFDVSVLGGYRWVDDLGHVAGATQSGATGALALRWIR